MVESQSPGIVRRLVIVVVIYTATTLLRTATREARALKPAGGVA